MENTLRARLSLPCIGTMEVRVCPSCGGDHRLTDCGGQPVRRVVALAQGEYVARRRATVHKWRDLAPAELAVVLQNRVKYNP